MDVYKYNRIIWLDSFCGEIASQTAVKVVEELVTERWESFNSNLQKNAKTALIKLYEKIHEKILTIYNKLPDTYSIIIIIYYQNSI